MTEYKALRHIPHTQVFGPGDVFVLFGELFGRGYANGLVDQARAAGMTIVGITVGRRNDDGTLRSLTPDEHREAETRLGGQIINLPLMAGFDMDAPPGEKTPVEMLSEISLKNWQDYKLDWERVACCREQGARRFASAVARAMDEIDKLVPDRANVLFAHTMAGGVPRTKAFLAIANRVYKGCGDRFTSSRTLLESDLGKLTLMNFEDVTANTFQHLLESSAKIHNRVTSCGGQVRYVAYGYHGTEIIIGNEYAWQTYTNYTQGYAKMHLEAIARRAWEKGVAATVFNCPEVRTNSSDIFVGGDLSMLPLLHSLLREGGGAWADAQWSACQSLLRPEASLESVLERVDSYLRHPTSAAFRDLEAWPMDNTRDLADLMLSTADEIAALHADKKAPITDHLSALVLDGVGPLMFHGAAAKIAPVLWLNHDIVARQLNAMHGS